MSARKDDVHDETEPALECPECSRPWHDCVCVLEYERVDPLDEAAS